MTTLQALPGPRTAPSPVVLVRPARYEPEPGAAHPAPALVAHPRSPVPPETGPTQAAEAHAVIAPALRLALEVLDGRRPAEHLGPLATPAVLRYWRAARGQRRARTPARLVAVRLCLPAPGAAEVAAVCGIDGRVRALAARFERRRGRWLCTAVRLG
jgi:uncharacterized protein DUF6459